jgi:CRP/FNR family transcriptional regulator, cyclic AMP receptor protein
MFAQNFAYYLTIFFTKTPYNTFMTPSYSTPLTQTPMTTPPYQGTKSTDFSRRALSKGDTLYYSGDEADTVYRVEEGLLKLSIDLLTGKERITSIAGPGDYIGALTPAHTNYQETAEALSQSVVLQAAQRNELNDDLKTQISTAAGIQLARMRDTLEDSELPVPSRLARTFVRLGQRFGNIAEDKTVHLALPLTHDNFAAIVGAARETTTAILSEMRENGLVEGTRGHYSFNMNTLSDFASEAAFMY